MARNDLHFRLRIPENLKENIEEAAKSNGRSMTAEIIFRLSQTFDREVERDVQELWGRVETLEDQVSTLLQLIPDEHR